MALVARAACDLHTRTVARLEVLACPLCPVPPLPLACPLCPVPYQRPAPFGLSPPAPQGVSLRRSAASGCANPAMLHRSHLLLLDGVVSGQAQTAAAGGAAWVPCLVPQPAGLSWQPVLPNVQEIVGGEDGRDACEASKTGV